MQTILSVIILILAAIDLRHAQKIKDLEERTIESFRIICRRFEGDEWMYIDDKAYLTPPDNEAIPVLKCFFCEEYIYRRPILRPQWL